MQGTETSVSFLTRQPRVTFALGLFMLFLGFVILLLRIELIEYLNFSPTVTLVAGLGSLLYGTAFLLLLYLRGDFSSTRILGRERETSEQHDDGRLYQVEIQVRRLFELIEASLPQIAGKPDSPNTAIGLTQAERDKIVEVIRQRIQDDLGEGFLRAIEDKYAANIINSQGIQRVRENSDRIVRRLRGELEALSRRGNLNLVIGSLTTSIAVGTLLYMVSGITLNFESGADIIEYYLPRLSLVIFIEVFAFFFLRLYKSSLAEIKYFQNELTNIEAKLVALDAALVLGEKESLNLIVGQFALTERNVVLKNGESTVDLERLKLENLRLEKLVDKLAAAIPSLRANSA